MSHDTLTLLSRYMTVGIQLNSFQIENLFDTLANNFQQLWAFVDHEMRLIVKLEVSLSILQVEVPLNLAHLLDRDEAVVRAADVRDPARVPLHQVPPPRPVGRVPNE